MNEAKQIDETFVEREQVQIVYWPNLDGIQQSTNMHVVAHCAGFQDPVLFWLTHDQFFALQNAVWQYSEQELIETAVGFGANQAELEVCYFGGEGLAAVERLDEMADERGIRGRPVFDINGTVLYGGQSFEVFTRAIEAGLGGS